ncbi:MULTISPECIES: DUF4224 domain-containing protein [Pseudoalteromonas]|uniref:DUF4224 domain-containing protein n=1 Tax=Pseudoalteromonas maricaloris TaxID=184924 RepID=A0A8I2HA76_9GAMM|nr:MULTISPECIES: DUF4224 domain-containing protein [Pseudoalteromonas]NLR22981.1 DUF4224 domain-containing protein [Pseudoalteromonas maricaloris]WMO12647.1 DUF4224 domain-containing protein [Pseudoalteromonas piscicida]WOX27886.1 DUF4224 domain-containing protein [Pseudoalteromonas maricaloris]
MNSLLFLNKQEMNELTGRKQKKRQVEQLIQLQLPFTLDAFGWPKVLRKTIETELGAGDSCQIKRGGATLSDDELYTGQ